MKVNKQAKTTIRQKTKPKQIIHKSDGACFVLADLSRAWGPFLEEAWYTQWPFVGETQHPLSQQVLIANSFLVRGRILCPRGLLSSGILSGLHLCRYCVFFHSLCEVIHVSVLCLEDDVSLESLTVSGSYNFPPPLLHIFLSLEGRVWGRHSIWGCALKVSHVLHISSHGSSVLVPIYCKTFL